jgi:N-succinyldiaminopimelate aminotransferase
VSRAASRLAGFGTTIFTEMSALAERTGAINLGQGFPDEDGPAAVLEAAVAALRAGANQYAPLPGVPALRAAIAEHQRSRYGLEHDPDTEIQVCFGATEAITAALLGLCEPGDEVVALDPFYDSYRADAALAGARLVGVPLRPPGWRFDPGELAAAVTDRTRVLLLNTPHNPTGRVLDRDELEAIAAVCRERDLIAISDEVYEHLVYEGAHVPLATLPEMGERTLTISSIGKTFSVTGWKTGWACGPAELVAAVRGAKQFMTFAGGTPFQHAAAVALGMAEDHGARLAAELKAKRDRLCDGLERAGAEVLRPAGTYFANADVRPLGYDDGVAFCRDLPERAGVVAIPTSVFSADPDRVRSLVRFAFCKREEVIDAAAERLATLR